MARFQVDYDETFEVPTSVAIARDHFGNLETIAKNYGPLESWKKVDDETLHLVLSSQSERGISFRPWHICRYQKVGDDRVVWKTTESDCMWSEGTVTFSAIGPTRTRVVFQQRMAFEIGMPSLLGKVIAPIVRMRGQKGVAEYTERMRKVLPRG